MKIFNTVNSYTFNTELKGNVNKFRESDLHCELIGIVVEVNNEYLKITGEFGTKCLNANHIFLDRGYVKVLDIGGA